jgi:hypothetical protein
VSPYDRWRKQSKPPPTRRFTGRCRTTRDLPCPVRVRLNATVRIAANARRRLEKLLLCQCLLSDSNLPLALRPRVSSYGRQRKFNRPERAYDDTRPVIDPIPSPFLARTSSVVWTLAWMAMVSIFVGAVGRPVTRPPPQSGRSTARACVGQWLPRYQPFPASWQKAIRPCITFPQAPLSSRTVGFPESGWQPVMLRCYRDPAFPKPAEA